VELAYVPYNILLFNNEMELFVFLGDVILYSVLPSQIYVSVLLCLCILIVTYAVFCIFLFHRANWHSSATLTEVFPYFFLSCKANVRV